ncbi:N-acetylmuramoyl-L-alanine amidase [uncultured Enterovirga sp.]|uniref:N-acetylmuramoyl-L-alanine amidase n=1 Tax=uncultured Enterovirga sp. TaxID=2026352 RepID=UPI0035CABA14
MARAARPRHEPALDSPVAIDFQPSPNHGERRGDSLDLLILHYTGMRDGALALARLCDPAAEVSAHYVVLETGDVRQLVPESRRAWHAGAGAWAGESDINSRSIGIELVHPGHDGGLPAYPASQIEAVVRLASDIVARWNILPERVLAHSDVSPSRKEDPGEGFPWDLLHAAGIGHWARPAPLGEGRVLAPGETGRGVEMLQAMLARYGYGIERTGTYDAATTAVVTAFQRHFRPALLDGRADLSTVATLRELIRTLPVSA